MKRVCRLFERIADRDNLRLAFARASRGKRGRGDAQAYAAGLEENLCRLREQLLAGSVLVGRFRQFVIHDPKERIITAPCFAERVLHHAILNVCEPHFERRLIDDTYACRRGKGRIAAVSLLPEARRAEVYAELCRIVDQWLETLRRDGKALPPPTAGQGIAQGIA